MTWTDADIATDQPWTDDDIAIDSGLPPQLEMARDLTAGGLRGAASIGATLIAPVKAAFAGTGQSGAQAEREKILRDMDAALKYLGANQKSLSYQGGKAGAEIAGTAGVFPAAPASGVLGRMAQGGIAGAGGTAIVDPESTGVGAAFGAGIPIAGKVASTGMKVTGGLYDAITGQLSKVRAGKLMRDAAGPEVDAIRRAWANAGDDLTAAQAAAGSGRYEMQALGEIARRGDPSVYGAKLAQQASDADLLMQQMAKGRTAEEAGLYRDQFSLISADELVPIRDSILNKLKQTGLTLDELLPQLSQKEAAYVAALQNQGRMATEAAQATTAPTPLRATRPQTIPGEPTTLGSNVVSGRAATGNLPEGNFPPDPRVDIPIGVSGFRVGNEQGGIPRAPVRYTPNVDRAAEFQGAADELGGIASGLRTEADALRQQISALPSTFTAAPVRNAVSAMAGEVGGAKRTVANAVSEELRIAGDDPALIAKVRSLSVNQLVGELLQSGKLSKEDAAAALVDVKKLIDKQLGTEFVEKYMKPYAKKLEYRASLELVDELRRLQKENPKQFLQVVRGENPDLVAKYGDWKTIRKALGSRRFGKVSKLASDIERNQEMSRQATEGADNLLNIMRKDNFGFRLPGFLHRGTTATNAALDVIEAKLNSETRALISQAMKSGASANELMAMVPANERNAAMMWITQGGPERYLRMSTPALASE